MAQEAPQTRLEGRPDDQEGWEEWTRTTYVASLISW